MTYRLLNSIVVLTVIASPLTAQTLEERLLGESPAELAAAARTDGDPRRGAIVFYQPYMSCRTCHDSNDPNEQLGPDLTKWEQTVADEYLVEAILQPSKKIRSGYESLTVFTEDGLAVVGLIVRNDDTIVLRDPSQPGKLHTFQRDELDEIVDNENSLMPQSLVNQLSSRQQFLDLVRYLMEIRDGGSLVARNLEPAPHLYAARPLPAYEQSIDHAGMITELNDEHYARGEAIYNRLCVNCHGTHEKMGSLPTSLRFASGQFKNGYDPYTMYQTLTRGFGMMQPQAWMVPQQKYDVIHYIREAYLKTDNSSQYFEVTDDWLAGLPQGDSRGPGPQTLEPWVTMDYGRTLINTYEVGDAGTNFAYKGIAVRLDSGPGGVSRGRHWMIFDHDTLRMSVAWSGEGFIDWKGIHFNGQHGIHPRVVGQVQAQNKTGPGWAEPSTNSWDDPRLVGRDGRRYGPLPHDWAHYQGMSYSGDETIISYRVGTTSILEKPELLSEATRPVYARCIQLGPRDRDLNLQVAQLDDLSSELSRLPSGAAFFGPREAPLAPARKQPRLFDGESFAQVDEAEEFDMTNQDFTITARMRTRAGGVLFAKTEPGAEWVPDGKVLFVGDGRLCYDIGWVGAVESRRRVNDGRWHNVAMTWDHETGVVTLYIDGRKDSESVLRPEEERDDQVVRIGMAAPDFPSPSFLKGKLESLRFYTAKLTQAQIVGDATTPTALADWDLGSAGETIQNRAGEDFEAVVHGEGSTTSSQLPYILAGIRGAAEGLKWHGSDGALRLTIPKGNKPLSILVWFAALNTPDEVAAVEDSVDALSINLADLESLTKGGPSRHPESVVTQPLIGNDDGPFAVDVLTRPERNPWLAQVRLTGFDFFADGNSAAVCSWDGDVWKVTGIESLDGSLQWRRIATGLFQPLGVRIVDGEIYVTCRDQLVILRDINDDGETDFYQNFNNDHQVTDHFHEFAMGLQTDDEGNFYYAKSARHALTAVVPHHGTLLRVSKDGSKTDIIANGFRAANGVCLNPDGSFIVTDQEGHWNPKNRINWVREGGFYGNMFGYHDVTDPSDSAMEQPLCWITNSFDRSPSELLWVPKGCWGPLGGSLLNLSYGYGKVFVVPYEEIDGQPQGGMCELPIPQFPTGLVRGRFHPKNGHLYSCGMFAWAGNQQQPGGFYRIRTTGKPMHLPVTLEAKRTGMVLGFTDALSKAEAEDPTNYSITAWDLRRTKNYGSDHYNERAWRVTLAKLSPDGKTVSLTIPDLAPTWGMEIRCFLTSRDGKRIERRIHNSIHRLGEG